MRSWLFLPPSAHWPEVVEAAAERHAQLYGQCLRAALAAHNADERQQQPGSPQALTAEAAAARPFLQLPARLQLLLLTELHAELCRRFDRQRFEGEGWGVQDLLDSAAAQAPHFLAWLEAEKRGRLPDAAAYAALCAGAGLSRSPEVQGRQKQLLRVAAAYQAELVRLGLAALADLPLLARRALAAEGSAALEWARERWRHVLVDEFQDTGSAMVSSRGDWQQRRQGSSNSSSSIPWELVWEL
jgi:superfamily I DNA/RNA helicase